MRRYAFAISSSAFLCLVASAAILLAQQKPVARTQPPASGRPAAALMTVEARNAFLQQYCIGCHNEKLQSGNMTLTSLDLAHVDQNAELAEKIVKKLRTGLMPP